MTPVAAANDEDPASVALQFRTVYDDEDKRNGPRVIFTPSEWAALVDNLDGTVQEGLVEGDFDKLTAELGPDNTGQAKLAMVGVKPYPKKILRIDGTKTSPVLSIQTWSKNGGPLRTLPMMNEGEFTEAFLEEDLDRADRERLFKDGDLSVLVGDR